MADNEPSTSRGPEPKKRRSAEPKRVYTEEEIQKIIEDLEDSDDDLELIDDLEESDFSDPEEELVAPEQPQSPASICEEIPDVVEEGEASDSDIAVQQPISLPGPSNTTDKWLPNPPDVTKINFTGRPGMRGKPNDQSPFGYFNLFFNEDFCSYLAKEINNYAIIVLFDSDAARARISNWKNVTTDEIRTFVGELMLMGLIRVNRMNDCWKRHYLFNLPFSQFMGRDRFLVILRCLHFQSERTGSDPIFKIRPLMDYFNNKMKELCIPSRELSIDESMVLWRGKLLWRQYVQGKRHKFGFKLYVLSQPNGLVHKIHIYGGTRDLDVSGVGHAAKVVRKLMEDLEEEGHALYMDNFYNSVPLTEELLANKMYTTGTLQSKRRGNPKEVLSKKIAKGESFCMYTKEGVCCCKWKDKREVLSISSEFGGNLVTTTNKRGQEKNKPKLIVEYNKNMKGVDRQDQMLSYYPLTHKTLRWYKKLGIHIFHLMLNNAYFLYNMYSEEKKYDLHDFHLEVVTKLLPNPTNKPPAALPKDHIHLPQNLPKNAKNETMRKRCKECSATLKIRKETVFGCPSCPGFPGLCLDPCFRLYHKYK